MASFLSSLIAGIPGLISNIFNLIITYTGLKNTPTVIKGKQVQVVVDDNTTNTTDVDKAITSGDVTVLQDKGNVK